MIQGVGDKNWMCGYPREEVYMRKNFADQGVRGPRGVKLTRNGIVKEVSINYATD